MNPLEERLNQLETRVTRYRNFNILLCLLLVTIVTVAATDGRSPFQAKSIPDSVPMLKGNVGVPDLPDERIMYPDTGRAGKVASQIQGVIRTRGLQIVNSNGQAVVELWPSTAGGGLIFVNSAEDKNLVYIGSSASGGHGLVHINSKEEKNLIGMGGLEDGGIWISNRNEVTSIGLRAVVGISGKGTGEISINNIENNLVGQGMNIHGSGLRIHNESGTKMAVIYAGETSGGLALWNNNRKEIARLDAYSAGDGFLKINSKTGTELITLGSNTNDDGLIRISNRYGTLGVGIIGAEEHGEVLILNAQDRLLAEMTATAGGNGLIRTLSSQGITTWSSNSVQVNTGSGTSLKGDMDNDGDIDGDDFLIFSENFGQKR